MANKNYNTLVLKVLLCPYRSNVNFSKFEKNWRLWNKEILFGSMQKILFSNCRPRQVTMKRQDLANIEPKNALISPSVQKREFLNKRYRDFGVNNCSFTGLVSAATYLI